MTVKMMVEQYYKLGDTIFPDAVQRKVNISKKKAYQELEALSPDMLRRVYIIRCPHCGSYLNGRHETIRNIPKEAECFGCDTEFPVDLGQNVIVVYKRN